MLQLITRLFSKKEGKTTKKATKNKSGNSWAEKQFKEMGKLRGKLILM
jgi:hypothetical protein